MSEKDLNEFSLEQSENEVIEKTDEEYKADSTTSINSDNVVDGSTEESPDIDLKPDETVETDTNNYTSYQNQTENNTVYHADDSHYSRPYSEMSWDQSPYNYPKNGEYNQQNVMPKYNTYGTNYSYTQPVEYQYTQKSSAQIKKEKKKEKKKDKKKAQIGITAMVIILSITVLSSTVLGFGGGLLAGRLNNKNQTETKSSVTETVPKQTGNEPTKVNNSTEMTTTEIAEMTADSVVEIVTEVVKTESYFQQYITSGAGSGVIISNDGYIITNNHVIEGARKITVTLRDGNSYEAELLGRDSEIDVALIKIEPDETLTVANFGDSSTLKVGDKTVVIGNPLGQLGGTVTDGIVSALDRNVTIDGKTMNLLQTNAAINPGNSGGGIFNSHGELIGLVVAKSTGSTIEGLGFAIPINNVIDVLDDLMQYGYVRGRVSLGISLIDITTQQMAMMYGVSELGCYISSVELNSNASRAGLQSGDRIIAINGTEITSGKEVSSFVDKASVGDTVELTVSRNGRTGTISMVLAEETPDGVKTDEDQDSDINPFENESGQNNGESILDDILNSFGF